MDQAVAARRALPTAAGHIHLDAAESVLRERFAGRHELGLDEAATFDIANAHAIEAGVDSLRTIADAVIDTTDRNPEDVGRRAVTWLRDARV